LREIREGAGRQFDPDLADTFIRLMDREPALAA
jgi:HD-GYP domain-containing protein (c-di-GMP phosphodiesterase class II)